MSPKHFSFANQNNTVTPDRRTDQPTTSTPISNKKPNNCIEDEFKIVVTNCEGVTGKKLLLENMLLSTQPDVFIAVESKLDKTVSDAEFLPPPYLDPPPSRRDRIRGGGGVFIATKSGLTAVPLENFDTQCEIRWIKILLKQQKTLIVGVYYHPPKATIKSLEELNKSIGLVRTAYPDAILFLGGDFNLSGIDWEGNKCKPRAPKKKMCETLIQIADEFNLEQLNQPGKKIFLSYYSPRVQH